MQNSTQTCIDLMVEHVIEMGELAGQAAYIEKSLRGVLRGQAAPSALRDLEGVSSAMLRESVETLAMMCRNAPFERPDGEEAVLGVFK